MNIKNSKPIYIYISFSREICLEKGKIVEICMEYWNWDLIRKANKHEVHVLNRFFPIFKRVKKKTLKILKNKRKEI